MHIICYLVYCLNQCKQADCNCGCPSKNGTGTASRRWRWRRRINLFRITNYEQIVRFQAPIHWQIDCFRFICLYYNCQDRSFYHTEIHDMKNKLFSCHCRLPLSIFVPVCVCVCGWFCLISVFVCSVLNDDDFGNLLHGHCIDSVTLHLSFYVALSLSLTRTRLIERT